jgi:hypothetical protein
LITLILNHTKTLIFFGCVVGLASYAAAQQINESRDLYFRVQIPDGEGKRNKKAWHIRVPYKYVHSLIGTNGDDDPKTGFGAQLIFDLNTSSGALRNHQRDEKNADWVRIYLSLTNTYAPITKDLQKDICLDTNSITSELIRGCKTENCIIFSSYNGWSTEIIIKRDLYPQKEKFCGKIFGILHSWTVRVDDLKK